MRSIHPGKLPRCMDHTSKLSCLRQLITSCASVLNVPVQCTHVTQKILLFQQGPVPSPDVACILYHVSYNAAPSACLCLSAYRCIRSLLPTPELAHTSCTLKWYRSTAQRSTWLGCVSQHHIFPKRCLQGKGFWLLYHLTPHPSPAHTPPNPLHFSLH